MKNEKKEINETKETKETKEKHGHRTPNAFMLDDAASDFSRVEAYKAIRTNIMYSLPKSDTGKVIMVTSSIPNEGKTTNSINLALTFAQTGLRVVLVDCDLRKPRVHRYLKMQLGEGVSNYICGYAEYDKVLQKDLPQGFDLMTAGEIPPNPTEILASERFSELIERLKSEYDYIFLDTPPVTVVADAAIVSASASGVVVVVKADFTTYDVLDQTVESLNKVDAKIFGFILTNTAAKNSSRRYERYKYKYYNDHYGDRYGDRYGDHYSDHYVSENE